jgi:hypothetical protein
MCTSVCPTQALFYGTYEEFVQAGRAGQGAKPVNVFYFGRQRVRTRNYVVMREQDKALDLMALAEEAIHGAIANVPLPTLEDASEPWVEADTAGIPERVAPPQPWAPRTPPAPPAPSPAPAPSPERVPTTP